jgi:hypothetical protein
VKKKKDLSESVELFDLDYSHLSGLTDEQFDKIMEGLKWTLSCKSKGTNGASSSASIVGKQSADLMKVEEEIEAAAGTHFSYAPPGLTRSPPQTSSRLYELYGVMAKAGEASHAKKQVASSAPAHGGSKQFPESSDTRNLVDSKWKSKGLTRLNPKFPLSNKKITL